MSKPYRPLRQRPLFHNAVRNMAGTKEGSVSTIDSEIERKYYSSLDVEIYFGNIYIDEIVKIEYIINQNTMPLFGYNSYIYDQVVQGSRMVQGSFVVNFIQPRYLFSVLESMADVIDNKNQTVSGEGGNQLSENNTDEELMRQEEEENLIRIETNPLWNKSFDIDIMYGESVDIHNTIRPKHNMLTGVVLISCEQEISSTNNPVLQGMPPGQVFERYSFIARDIISKDS